MARVTLAVPTLHLIAPIIINYIMHCKDLMKHAILRIAVENQAFFILNVLQN